MIFQDFRIGKRAWLMSHALLTVCEMVIRVGFVDTFPIYICDMI